ncbi:MAG: hypothetical protein FGM32_10085 [Candidatus Kapabacteria bacterium]|nr:hypothetical protein [Candidatus Kapabacteria bacterium]
MKTTGYIEIRISGFKGNLELTPENYDVKELGILLKDAEDLLFPSESRGDRPIVSYNVEQGSVRHRFTTSLHFIIGLNAVIAEVQNKQSIDFMHTRAATAVESIQRIAKERDYAFTISTSLEQSSSLRIDADTNYHRTETEWVDAEFYFYGTVTNAGGKDKANIHVSTVDHGTLRVETPKAYLEQFTENMLYRSYGVRAVGRQNLQTGEIDTTSLRFVEMIDYQPKYDEAYLKSLRDKAMTAWIGEIDPEQWLRDVRGGYGS